MFIEQHFCHLQILPENSLGKVERSRQIQLFQLSDRNLSDVLVGRCQQSRFSVQLPHHSTFLELCRVQQIPLTTINFLSTFHILTTIGVVQLAALSETILRHISIRLWLFLLGIHNISFALPSGCIPFSAICIFELCIFFLVISLASTGLFHRLISLRRTHIAFDHVLYQLIGEQIDRLWIRCFDLSTIDVLRS
uniref:(northern house mosquito) hypothetical protein n=1 Tax=Culex pipiens TaxID=7175 RepID=A0A8D7ZXN1_CULPI